jgi:hypothetical protein
MFYVSKSNKVETDREKGFVMIVALMAIVVLTAVGFFALTMISEELMISSRMLGERRAFSAAESGAYMADADMSVLSGVATPPNDPSKPVYTFSKKEIDDTTSVEGEAYWIRKIPVEGFSMEYSFEQDFFRIIFIGKDSSFGSSVSVEVGARGELSRTEDTIYKP